jgi:hypothetical protein
METVCSVIENLDVTEKVKTSGENWESGFWDGQASLTRPLLPFYSKKSAMYWTPYERGYWMGREMAAMGI